MTKVYIKSKRSDCATHGGDSSSVHNEANICSLSNIGNND